MPEHAEMITLDEAFEIVDEALADIRMPTETVAIRQALGRTLTADQASRLDLPPFDKSAMDGYAIPAGDEREEYPVIESVAAGEVPTRKLEPGTALKVMTGAPVPEADTLLTLISGKSFPMLVDLRRARKRAIEAWLATAKTSQLISASGYTYDGFSWILPAAPPSDWDGGEISMLSFGTASEVVKELARFAQQTPGGDSPKAAPQE